MITRAFLLLLIIPFGRAAGSFFGFKAYELALLQGGASQSSKNEHPRSLDRTLDWEESDIDEILEGNDEFWDYGAPTESKLTGSIQMITNNFKDGVEGAVRKAEKVARELKGLLSSEFEQTVLKATRPDDDPAKEKHVHKLEECVKDFQEYLRDQDNYNPYRALLHKLWSRLAERDWRTCAKALYILHRLARKVNPEHSRHFMKAMASWQQVYSRKSGSTYFHPRAVAEVHASGRPYAEWLRHYSVFVFDRLSLFTSEYDELWMLSLETSYKKAADVLHDAKQLITQALACSLGTDLDNDITCPCLALVARDLRELWRLFGHKLLLRAEQRALAAEAGGVGGGGGGGGLPDDHLSATMHFCEFYLANLGQVQNFIKQSAANLKHYNIIIENDVPVIDTDIIEEELREIREILGYTAKK